MSRLVTEGPTRYSQNAFRLLSLPVTATGSEIQLRADEICVRAKMGQPCDYLYDFAWMGPLDRTEESIRDALHRLSDPVQRTREELAWFRVWGSHDEEALGRLRKNDKAGASRIWESRQEAGDEASIIATFNRAILTHSAAIGEELLLSRDLGSLVQLDADEAHWKNWRLALETWHNLIKDAQFWTLLKCIAKTRSDARLVDSTIEELRHDLLGEVLHPSFAFLRQALEGHDVARAKRHAETIRQASLPEESFRPWFAESLRRYTEALREACEATIQALREQRIEEVEASTIKPKCLQIYQTLRDRSQEALALGALLDAENHTDFAVERDRYGATLRQLAIPMANGGQAYADAMELVEEALRWAVSPSAQAQLKEDRDTLERLLAASGQQMASDGKAEQVGAGSGAQADKAPAHDQEKKGLQALEIKLSSKGRYSYHGVCCCCLAGTSELGTVEGQRTEYQVIRNITHTLKITLPFCKECQIHAQRETNRSIWWWVIVIAVGLCSMLLLDVPGATWLLPASLTFLANGIVVLCLNKWLPRISITSPHVSRRMAAQMHSLEGDSFVLRFLNLQFGNIFLEGNRSIVLEHALIKPKRGVLNSLRMFNNRHGLATSLIAGFFALVSFAVMESEAPAQRSVASPRVRSTPQLSSRRSISDLESVSQALDRERAVFETAQQAFERDVSRLGGIRQQIETLATQINAIDAVYNIQALPENVYYQRLQLVTQHNALVDQHETLAAELIRRKEALESQRLSFNEKVQNYNQRVSR